ncbi:uncharacterized protein IWZ02DRAFT_447158 [Phyllosticta citriasiana]|uniref:Uncharacterized protein n=1 Tax=Phyllosticta citriasiana TaxID=595635 RepID=A0ABR1KNA0_9PEZI
MAPSQAARQISSLSPAAMLLAAAARAPVRSLTVVQLHHPSFRPRLILLRAALHHRHHHHLLLLLHLRLPPSPGLHA